MARHAEVLLDPPTAPVEVAVVKVGPVGGSSPTPADGPHANVRTRARQLLMVGVLVAVAAVSGLTGGLIAVTMAPQTTQAFTPSTSSVEVATPAVATPAPAATRPATPARVEEATTGTRPSTSGRSRASSNNPQSAATETGAGDTDDEDGGSSSGGSTRSSRGDGCGPYEHKLPTGYCSPDTDVLDENGNPDPGRAVVPGNLR